jgi:hypothetical protein
VARLKNWAVVGNTDPYAAPELFGSQLNGLVYDHPSGHFLDGEPVTTSSIVKAEGRQITTRSGTVYLLDGPPAPEYVAFCKSIGRTIDEANPIKRVGG